MKCIINPGLFIGKYIEFSNSANLLIIRTVWIICKFFQIRNPTKVWPLRTLWNLFWNSCIVIRCSNTFGQSNPILFKKLGVTLTKICTNSHFEENQHYKCMMRNYRLSANFMPKIITFWSEDPEIRGQFTFDHFFTFSITLSILRKKTCPKGIFWSYSLKYTSKWSWKTELYSSARNNRLLLVVIEQ